MVQKYKKFFSNITNNEISVVTLTVSVVSTFKCPIRDKILVEKISYIPLCVLLRTRYNDMTIEHSVPDGTAGKEGIVFYQY